jgi:hypothetical protein
MSKESEITRKLFRKYDLDLFDVTKRDFLNPNNIFPMERDCSEFRATFGTVKTIEWLQEMYNEHDTLESYDKDFKESVQNYKNSGWPKKNIKEHIDNLKKVRQEFINDLETIGTTFENDAYLTFSFFCKNEDRYFSLKEEKDIEFIYEAAYYYMRFLRSTCDCVYKSICEDLFKEDVELFKSVLEESGITINNDNIDYLSDISYRLYKDSKFFMSLEDHLGQGSYEQFIRDFEYILDNDVEDIDFEEEILNNTV